MSSEISNCSGISRIYFPKLPVSDREALDGDFSETVFIEFPCGFGKDEIDHFLDDLVIPSGFTVYENPIDRFFKVRDSEGQLVCEKHNRDKVAI